MSATDFANNQTPFFALTPDVLLDALESVGLRPDGRLLALNSYENRVYQVGMEDGPMRVVKFYRPGRWSDTAILEEHDFSAELAAHELPVVAPLVMAGRTLHHAGGLRFSVFPRQGGRAPEFEHTRTLEWMGRVLGRIHAIGAAQRYRARGEIGPHTYGEVPRDFLRRGRFVPKELADVYFGVVEQALDGVQHCYERAGSPGLLRLHGDCHAGNVLWVEGEEGGPWFVDFDDSLRGPAVQDLWMLLSGTPEEQSQQLGSILSGYEHFRAFDRSELHLIEALRTLRLIHYAGWLARRWDDPAFPAAFPWFNTRRYWEERILELREQIALMQEPPLQAV